MTQAKPHPIINPGDKVSTTAQARIYDGVRNRSLPKPEWSHGAHLVFACAVLDDIGLEAAEARVPDLIRAYNLATGVENSDTDGYHHTITLFYLRMTDRFMAARPSADLATQTTALLASIQADRDYPLTCYSRAHLFSVAARHGWVEPDLQPLS